MTNKISSGFDFFDLLLRVSNRKFIIFSISVMFCFGALIYEKYKPTKFSGVYELTIAIEEHENKTAILNNLLKSFGSSYYISNETLAKLFIVEFNSMRQSRKGIQAAVNQVGQSLQIEYNNSTSQAPLLELQQLVKRTEVQINKIIYEDIYQIWYAIKSAPGRVGYFDTKAYLRLLQTDTRLEQIISYAKDFNEDKHGDFYRLVLSENPSNLTQTRFLWVFILLSTVIGFLLGFLIVLILIEFELKEKL